MSAAAEQYLKLAKKHLDRIVIAVLFLILAGLIFVLFQEQTGTVGLEGDAGKQASFPVVVDQNKQFDRVMAMATKPDMTSYPAIQQIAIYNMFDYKSVKDKEQIERGADQRFAQAQEAANKGNAEEAKRLIGEILRQVPSHRKARELLETLNAGGDKKPGAVAASAAPAAQ